MRWVWQVTINRKGDIATDSEADADGLAVVRLWARGSKRCALTRCSGLTVESDAALMHRRISR